MLTVDQYMDNLDFHEAPSCQFNRLEAKVSSQLRAEPQGHPQFGAGFPLLASVMARRRPSKRSSSGSKSLTLDAPSSDSAPHRSRRKKWLIRSAVAVMGPTLFLAASEGALRLVGYGHSTKLLLPARMNDADVWIPNRLFGRRFFGDGYERQPLPFAIARDKPADVVRVLVFGESAAFG